MDILIADQLSIYRHGLKSIIFNIKPNAVVDEAINFDDMATKFFNKQYRVLILAIDLPGNEKLDDFLANAVNTIKVITIAEHRYSYKHVENLLKIGVEALLLRTTSLTQLTATLTALLQG